MANFSNDKLIPIVVEITINQKNLLFKLYSCAPGKLAPKNGPKQSAQKCARPVIPKAIAIIVM